MDEYRYENEVPNDETLEAIRELEEIKKNPDEYKKYSNVKEMINDCLKSA